MNDSEWIMYFVVEMCATLFNNQTCDFSKEGEKKIPQTYFEEWNQAIA